MGGYQTKEYIMGKLRKLGKKIGRGIKSVGRKIKKGFGKIAGAFGKLGPLGTIALSFILPGVGNFLTGMADSGGVTGFIGDIALKISNGASMVKNGVGKVFNRVTDAIEGGMNAVSQPFMKPDLTGARGAGSAFRDFVSDATGGFIDKSNVGLQDTTLNPTTLDMEVKGINAKDYDLSKNLKTGEFNNQADADYIDKLRNEGEFSRKVDSFKYKQSKKKDFQFGDIIENPLKNEAGKDVGVEFYKKDQLLADNTFKGDPIKTITDKSRLPKEVVVDKPSVFAEGDYDSFKARVKGSREFSTFKKLTPITTVGTSINATKDMEKMQRQQTLDDQAAYYSDVAMSSLGSTKTTDSSNVSYFDFNNPNPTPEQLFNLENAYSGILG